MSTRINKMVTEIVSALVLRVPNNRGVVHGFTEGGVKMVYLTPERVTPKSGPATIHPSEVDRYVFLEKSQDDSVLYSDGIMVIFSTPLEKTGDVVVSITYGPSEFEDAVTSILSYLEKGDLPDMPKEMLN